jgi:pimeloyl-ACP methyl ester carboxylesterase
MAFKANNVLNFIEIAGSKLYYKTYGSGAKAMLAFHGYGQGHFYFAKLAASLEREYTVYAFDLFFHGESSWKHKERIITKEEWKEFIRLFLEKHDVKEFSITGFSMGGKFLLSTLESYPEMVKEVNFIAPDGIKTSLWYSLATYPKGFKNIFKSFILKPKRFFHLVHIMKSAKIMDKGILKFATHQMDSFRKRRRVYLTWIVFSGLKFDLQKIANIINFRKIKVRMYLGKYDKIITPNNMHRLLHRLDDYEMIILETGHNNLIDEVAKEMDN